MGIAPSLPEPRPEDVAMVGGGDWLYESKNNAGLLIRHAGLRPHHRVLDVGCGFGRLAYTLAHHLHGEGSYDGFDCRPELARWGRDEVTPRCPRFHFAHADVRNFAYNPNGAIDPEEFRFPYGDASFDVACLFSVFTHMRPEPLMHYLDEIRRVLAPGGRMFATYFGATPDLRDASADHPSVPGLRYRFARPIRYLGRSGEAGECWYHFEGNPEAAIAYDPVEFETFLRDAGLSGPRHGGGGWSGGDPESFQDFVVAERR